VEKSQINSLKRQTRLKYAPEEFKEAETEPVLAASERHDCQECAQRTVMNSELEERLKRVSIACDEKLREQTRLHNYEIDKLVKVLMGSGVAPGSGEYYSDLAADSPLNDPVQMRLVLASRDRCQEMKRTIEKQKEMIEELSGQCGDLEVYKERSRRMEEVGLRLQEEVNRLNEELAEVRECCAGPELKSYEVLKGKIRKIEAGFVRRERELKKLVEKGRSGDEFGAGEVDLEMVEMRRFYEGQLESKNREIKKFKAEFDAMLQLLYSLK